MKSRPLNSESMAFLFEHNNLANCITLEISSAFERWVHSIVNIQPKRPPFRAAHFHFN